MTARILAFPPRRSTVIWLTLAREGGWLVLAGAHGWLFASRNEAWSEARWISHNFSLPIREVG